MENKPSTLQTRLTLLQRPQQDDQAAWDELVALYGPCICQWCRQWRLQDADMLDVTQAVPVNAELLDSTVEAVEILHPILCFCPAPQH
jgi:hypothetical protein